MNVHAHQDEEHIAGEQGLFFRATDRLRLEGYVSALTQSSMSLAMVSDHDAILDHYVKMLMARLREVAPQITLEVYFPANAEALMSRFNERLKALSIQDAMSDTAQSAQPKIWVLHDASALPDHEIQLLARLVHNFPGANIRVIMLFTQASHKKQLLNAFGRRILNWEIEAPNSGQRSAMLEQARAQGREVPVIELLSQLTPPPVFLNAPSAVDTGKRAEPIPVEKIQDLGSGQRRSKKWLLVCTLLFIACSLGVGLWYKDAINPLLATSTPPPPVPVLHGPAASTPLVLPQTALAGKDIEEILHTPAQAQAGQSWILGMPAASFVVLHSTASSFQEIKYWLQNQPQLKLAQIVAHTLPRQTGLQFSAVSAPFTTITEARGFAEGPGMPKDALVYSGQFLREQFPSEAKTMVLPQQERTR